MKFMGMGLFPLVIIGVGAYLVYKKFVKKDLWGDNKWEVESNAYNQNQRRRKKQMKKQNNKTQSKLRKLGIPSSYIVITGLIVYYVCNTLEACA